MDTKTLLKYGLLLGLAGSGLALADPPVDGDLYPDWGLFGGGMNFAAFDLGPADTDMAVDSVVGPDGSLYVVGTVQDENGLSRMGVAKFDADGILDSSFSGDGRNISLEVSVNARAVALTPGGHLLVAGYKVVNANDYDFIVCRFSAVNGANLSFPAPLSSPCVKPVFLPGTRDIANDIVAMADNKFVIGGTIDSGSQAGRAGFARFLTNGQPDLDFGNLQGSNMTVMRTENIFDRHAIEAIAIAGNGKIVGIGHTRVVNSDTDSGLLIRLEPDGTPEQLTPQDEYAFGLNELLNEEVFLYDVALVDHPSSDDDDIIVAGAAEVNGDLRGLIAKINHTGSTMATLDFGIGPGYTAVAVADADLSFNSIAYQPGVGFVVGGSRPGTDALDMVVQRFTMHGTPDFLFGDGGGVFVDLGLAGVLDTLAAVNVSGDGVYVAGSSLVGGGNWDYAVAKLGLDRIFYDGLEGFE